MGPYDMEFICQSEVIGNYNSGFLTPQKENQQLIQMEMIDQCAHQPAEMFVKFF